MHWFKHDTSANMDAKLQEVLLDYGLEGYGLYWYCIELIAGKISKENITFTLEHDARIIARNTGSTVVKVEEMMRRFVALGLFENSGEKITCMKLAKRLDQSMTSNPSMRALIASIKNHDDIQNNHDAIMTESSERLTESCKNRLDKIRIDKNSDIGKVSAKPKPRQQFTKPDLMEVYEYLVTRGINQSTARVEAEKFVDHYSSNGWKVGKNSMKDWKASVRNWTKNLGQQFGQQQQQAPQPRRALTHD